MSFGIGGATPFPRSVLLSCLPLEALGLYGQYSVVSECYEFSLLGPCTLRS